MKKDIALSIGHYHYAQGASFQGVTEHSLATRWVRAIQFESERIFVPRPGKLPLKVQQINDADIAVAFELHFNACGGGGVLGCETLYYPGSQKGKQIAEYVQLELVSLLSTKDRGAKEGWYKMDRPNSVDYFGDKEGDEMPDYFLAKTKMPSIILEPFFIEEAVSRQVDPDDIAAAFARVLEAAADAVAA